MAARRRRPARRCRQRNDKSPNSSLMVAFLAGKLRCCFLYLLHPVRPKHPRRRCPMMLILPSSLGVWQLNGLVHGLSSGNTSRTTADPHEGLPVPRQRMGPYVSQGQLPSVQCLLMLPQARAKRSKLAQCSILWQMHSFESLRHRIGLSEHGKRQKGVTVRIDMRKHTPRLVKSFAFWGHALLSARTVSSLSFTVLACISSGSGRGFRSRGLLAASERKAPLWLRQRSYANLVAPRDLQSERQQQFQAKSG